MKKKLISALLALALAVGMIPAFGVTAGAEPPTMYSITIVADYSNLVVGLYANDPAHISLGLTVGQAKLENNNCFWERYNESTGKYERVSATKHLVSDGKYKYHFSLMIDPDKGKPGSPFTVIINGKPHTVTVEEPTYGYYMVYVEDSEVITPRVLPPLSGKVSLDPADDPFPAEQEVKAVLSGGLENIPSEQIHYRWERKSTEDEMRLWTSEDTPSTWVRETESTIGEKIRVGVFADGYSGYVYSNWSEIGPAIPGKITVSAGKADKAAAKKDETVSLTAIPDNSDFAFDRWEVVNGSGSIDSRISPSTTYNMRYGDVQITGRYKIKSTAGTNPWSGKTNPFADVSKGTYCYDPVLWAYYSDPQVTNGIDETHFGPASTVTRGQCVAFLWRAMGEPEPTTKTNPFTDVPEWQYYYKPILWAVEKGITKGTSATTFSPDGTLSTAHIVTFLYRTLGKGSDGWYAVAGNWAKGDGLLDGTGLGVSDQTDCPRGAVVTFLYRELADPVYGVNELSKNDFLMYVEESYNITGRGRIVTGRVQNGSIRTGDKVTLISCDESTKAPVRTTYTVEGIEMFHKVLDEARKGDNAGILLSAATGTNTPPGSALVNEGSPLKSSPGRFVGTFKRSDEYVTKTLTLGDTFQVYWSGYDVTAMLVDLNGSDLKPDSTREGVKLTLLYPAVLYVGQELTIREGGRTYGTFTVTGIE